MKQKIAPIKKVIIPAAGWGTRFLPLTKTVHKELVPVLNKPILHYLAQEAAAAGIEEMILVISPRKLEILKYFTLNSELEHELKKKRKVTLLKAVQSTNDLIRISIVIQNKQLGLGHAIYVAQDLVGQEPFAVILGDDLIDSKVPAIKQLVDAYHKVGGKSIVGVQAIEQADIHKYGIVEPSDANHKNSTLFPIKNAVEKPSAAKAKSNKAILGRYILTPLAMELLKKLRKPHGDQELDIVDIFTELEAQEGIYAYTFSGKRYDLGSVEGFVKANIDFALKDATIADAIMSHIKTKIK